MKMRTKIRIACLGMASIVIMTFMPPLLKADETASGQAEEVVGSDNLNDIFDFDPGNKNVGFIYPAPDTNKMYLGDYKSFTSSDTGTANIGGKATGKNAISMEADWEISLLASIPYITGACCNNINFCTGLTKGLSFNGGYYTVQLGQSGGKSILDYHYSAAAGTTPTETTSISTTDYGENIPIKYSYTASDKQFHFSFRNKSKDFSYSLPNKEMYITILGSIDNLGSFSDAADKKLELTFVNARYSNYTPQFIETILLDENGNEIPKGTPIADGTIVTIQARVKNTYTDGGTVPCHLKLSDDTKKYPTNGLEFLTGSEQEVKVGHSADTMSTVADVNITGEGIPFECSPEDTYITYKAKISNPDGKEVRIGQMMVDNFFQSKRYSSAQLVPPLKEGTPGDDTGTPGEDYHYTRTPANANGWNNSSVEIHFYDGDFNIFDIKNPEGTVTDTLSPSSPSKQYSSNTAASGIPVTYQASNQTSGLVSATKDDLIKIDTNKPAIAIGNGSLLLADALSGIWKLQKMNSNGEYEDIQVFDLSEDGNGLSQQIYTAQNGIYRAVDAAGNMSEPFTADVTGPPDVSRPDDSSVPPVGPPVNPNDPVPDPSVEVDETGLKHAFIEETITEKTQNPPAFDGTFTAEDAEALINYRYQFTSNASPSDLSYTLKITDTMGNDITGSGFPTGTPGQYIILYKATDSEGNTTTIQVNYRFIGDYAPPVVVRPVTPPGTTPVGPVVSPSDIIPDPIITEDENGLKHAVIRETITQTITTPPPYGGTLDLETAWALMDYRYQISSNTGDPNLLTSLTIHSANGTDMTAQGFPTDREGFCVIIYQVTDSDGNTTTIYLTCHFIPESKVSDPSSPTSGTEGMQKLKDAGYSPASTKEVIIKDLQRHLTSTDRPQTGDILFGNKCFVHLLSLLLLALTIFYTKLRLGQLKNCKVQTKEQEAYLS